MEKPNKKILKQSVALIVILVFMLGSYGIFFVLNNTPPKNVELTEEELQVLLENEDIQLEEVQTQDNENNTQEENATQEAEMILFYSQSCPHCHNVSNFIKENNIDDKINLLQLDASGKYGELFVEKVKECGLDSQGYGVPFLYYSPESHDCIMGDTPIIDFFKNYLSL
jgi:glutaredoxin